MTFNLYVMYSKISPCFGEKFIKNFSGVWFLCFPQSTKEGSMNISIFTKQTGEKWWNDENKNWGQKKSILCWPVPLCPALSPLLELLLAVRLVTELPHVTRVPGTCGPAQLETVTCQAAWRGPVFPPGPPCVALTHDVPSSDSLWPSRAVITLFWNVTSGLSLNTSCYVSIIVTKLVKLQDCFY